MFTQQLEPVRISIFKVYNIEAGAGGTWPDPAFNI